MWSIINILSLLIFHLFSSSVWSKANGFLFRPLVRLRSIVASQKWEQFCVLLILFEWTIITIASSLYSSSLGGLWSDIEKKKEKKSAFCLEFSLKVWKTCVQTDATQTRVGNIVLCRVIPTEARSMSTNYIFIIYRRDRINWKKKCEFELNRKLFSIQIERKSTQFVIECEQRERCQRVNSETNWKFGTFNPTPHCLHWLNFYTKKKTENNFLASIQRFQCQQWMVRTEPID